MNFNYIHGRLLKKCHREHAESKEGQRNKLSSEILCLRLGEVCRAGHGSILPKERFN